MITAFENDFNRRSFTGPLSRLCTLHQINTETIVMIEYRLKILISFLQFCYALTRSPFCLRYFLFTSKYFDIKYSKMRVLLSPLIEKNIKNILLPKGKEQRSNIFNNISSSKFFSKQLQYSHGST